MTENLPLHIYVNKIKNKNINGLKKIIKTGYKLELLTLETMKLFRNTKKDVDKDKDGEKEPVVI